MRTMARRVALAALGLALLGLLAINIRSVPPCAESGREVCFRSADGVVLSGTLYLPDGAGPFPGVVLLHGSGPQTRLDRFAQALADAGLAVLTYDKRGVGRSGGRYCAGVNLLRGCLRPLADAIQSQAADAAAAVARLAQVEQVGPARIGLWGPSQGGWVAPVAAALSPRVAFLVQHSAPAVTYYEEDAYSQFLAGYPPDRFPSQDEIRAVMGRSRPGGFDPRPYIVGLRVPTLWLYGGRDRSIPVDASVANLRAWRPADAAMTIVRFAEADHDLRLPGEPGSPAASIRARWVDWVKALP